MKTYSPEKVLITGGAGFIGSNVINFLVSKYPEIEFINIDRLDYCSNLKSVQVNDAPNYYFYKSNIKNAEFINFILESHNIDTVINFAAQTHVDNSFVSSLQFTEDNILNLHHFLEIIRKYGKIKRFIHISTDEVYGEVDEDHPGCHEKSLLNPTNPYAASKAGAEFLVRSYKTSFGLPVIITRGNNVYGPYQYPEKIVPRFIHQLTSGQRMTIHGLGTSIRNFIHSEDVSRAIESILFRGQVGETYNIGTANEYNVMEIAKMLYDLLREKLSLKEFDQCIEYVPDRNFNDRRYAINSENLCSLGWEEKIQFKEGLKETVDWYLENLDHWDLAIK